MTMRRVATAVLCAAIVLMAGALAATTASATSYGASAWGGDWDGQLGDGTATLSSDVPRTVGTLTNVTAVAAGDAFGLALLESGHVWAWGYGPAGELGDGKTKNSDVPVEVSGITDAVAIAAGGDYALAVLSTGHVLAWGVGHDEPVEVSGLSEVTAVSTNGSHSLALLSDHKVKAWGDNMSGQLGDGTTISSTEPVEVSGLTEVAAVSAGGEPGGDTSQASYSLALLKNGTVWAWGYNEFGELGDGTRTGPETCSYKIIPEEEEEEETVEYACSLTPVQVSSIGTATAISAGAGTNLALLENGHVVHWGDLVDVPAEVSGLSGVTSIAAGGSSGDGGRHYLALLSSGRVDAWGQNTYGDLGDGTTVASETPVEVSELGGVEGIAASDSLSLSYGSAGPVVTSISPNSGGTAHKTRVTVRGSGLSSATAVYFGTALGTELHLISATELEVTSPTRKPGTVNVTVLANGTSGIDSADEYSYLPEGDFEFGRCTSVGSGKGAYKDNSCEEEAAGGGYEWTSGFSKTGFTSADATETVEKVVKPKKIEFETVGKATLVCENESGTGSYLGTTELTDVVLKFTGCQHAGAKCTSSGASEGEVVTDTLEGALGWIEREGNEIGVDLLPAGEETAFMAATCGSTAIGVQGSVIAQITPIDKMETTLILHFKQKKGKQAVEHIEGEANDVLEMSIAHGSYEQAGLTADIGLTGEEKIEVSTVK